MWKRILGDGMGKFVNTVCCALLSCLFATSAHAAKLIRLSVVCDPPRLHSNDPLGLRENREANENSSFINAFELNATSDLDDNKNLDGGSIKGSFTEVLVPIDVTRNKILFSSTSVNILHAIELKKEGASIQAQLYLIDKTKLETICYETSEGYFD